MMTPVYLNPPPSPFPLVEEKEEQHLQLFLSSHQATSSHSGPTFFNTAQYQRVSKLEESNLQHDQKGSIDRQVLSSSSLHPVVDIDGKNIHNLSLFKREDGEESRNDNESVKWMSSKIRLMQKMMTSNSTENDRPGKLMHKAHGQQHENYKSNSSMNNNNNIRVCADCNTTTTPLWRSGPQGPKSLCNACGIRQRKARRAMAAAAVAAANGTVIATEASSTKTKLNNKEKKSRTSHVAQHKKQFKPLDSPQSQKKICFKDFALSLSKNSAFQRVFPQDEEEAAILLMGLSCGFIYS